jgi:hypothetical protein
MHVALDLGPRLSTLGHRLAIGVQCIDALTGRPADTPLKVRIATLGPLTADFELEGKGGGRYALRDAGKLARLWDRTTQPGAVLPRTIDLRVHEASSGGEGAAPHRYMPRRVTLALTETPPPAPPVPGFRPRPLAAPANGFVVRLWPGPAYPFDGGGTVVRGCVRRGANVETAPRVRWPRVIATKGARVVGVAHGDERGEYTLLVRYPAGLISPLAPAAADAQVTLTAYGRSAAPAHSVPFDDLAAEPAAVAAADADPIADLPAAYNRQVAVARTLAFGAVQRGPDFELLLPP